jgi:hypothetical protein
VVDENSNSNSDFNAVHSDELINIYRDLVNKLSQYFPKVEKTLILDILKLETQKSDWIGSTTIEIQYKNNGSNLEEKKETLYNKFNMLPMEKDDKTLRFKAKRMYLEDIEELIAKDHDIEYISGSAKSTENDQYPSTHG